MTKSEKLDRLEANLSIMSEIMQTMIEQQQKQMEQQQQQKQIEAIEEPTNEGLTKAIVKSYANKITNLMENKNLEIDNVIELITKCNLTLIDRLRIADQRYRLYFIEPINHNVVGFTVDTELKWIKATLLY